MTIFFIPHSGYYYDTTDEPKKLLKKVVALNKNIEAHFQGNFPKFKKQNF